MVRLGVAGGKEEGWNLRVRLSRRFPELAVFDARLYIRVSRMDKPVERCGVCGRFWSQLHVAHEFAGALQNVRLIMQG